MLIFEIKHMIHSFKRMRFPFCLDVHFFLMFSYHDETLELVFHILHEYTKFYHDRARKNQGNTGDGIMDPQSFNVFIIVHTV